MWERDPTSVSHIKGRHNYDSHKNDALTFSAATRLQAIYDFLSSVCNKSTLGASPERPDRLRLKVERRNSTTMDDVLRNRRLKMKTVSALRLSLGCNNG